MIMLDVQLRPEQKERLVIYENSDINKAIADFLKEHDADEAKWANHLWRMCFELENKH